MDEPQPFRYLRGEEFIALSQEERAAYLERVKEHLAEVERWHRERHDKGV
jgi:hypothetical protein